jgi:hypothetical protein
MKWIRENPDAGAILKNKGELYERLHKKAWIYSFLKAFLTRPREPCDASRTQYIIGQILKNQRLLNAAGPFYPVARLCNFL